MIIITLDAFRGDHGSVHFDFSRRIFSGRRFAAFGIKGFGCQANHRTFRRRQGNLFFRSYNWLRIVAFFKVENSIQQILPPSM
mmetsp:Transcript_70399/g.204067  ORF Transcript_70399/g.204067 Transcript_70399/m.204067 type:complete len:83 (+) Transcript_70399:773-1021(+)